MVASLAELKLSCNNRNVDIPELESLRTHTDWRGIGAVKQALLQPAYYTQQGHGYLRTAKDNLRAVVAREENVSKRSFDQRIFNDGIAPYTCPQAETLD